MYDEKQIISALKQRAGETGGLTNINTSFVYQTVFSALSLDYGSERTNSQGEILDVWQVPFQIQFKPPTNFIIRSAGPDKNFSNTDDIIFSSLSNDFVKP